MKKIFLSVLLVLGALNGALAAGPWSTISLTKRIPTYGIPHPTVPGTTPLSVTEDDDFFSLEAGLSDDAIVLTASQATFAQVTIEALDGTVVYDQQEILGSEATEISTEGWAAGEYLIYIHVGEDVYEGAFEL